MRNGRGCQSCRSRHIKCLTQPGSSVCTRCKEGQRSCVFDSKFRFKKVDHVDTASQGVRSRTQLVYEPDQPWMPTRKAIGFILEDGAGAEYGTADFIERDECPDEDSGTRDPLQPHANAMEVLSNSPVGPVDLSQTDVDNQTTVYAATTNLHNENLVDTPEPSPSLETAYSAHSVPRRKQNSEHGRSSSGVARNSTQIAAIVEDYTSPASLSDLTRRHEGGRRLPWGTGEYGFLVGESSQEGTTVDVTQTSGNLPSIDLSHREALLMQHFTQKLAPWMDCCDSARHFALEVPRRAVRMQMVLYAVLALSSRHQSIMTGGDELEASYYHGQCLELVIHELSKPESCYDDNLFATIVCMRIYEELGDTVDELLHLQGIGNLLGAIPAFAHSGGLAEAASWQALRQDVYVAIRDKVIPSFDLDSYRLSQAFNSHDDGACANVVILLFARLLRLIHSPSGSLLCDTWEELDIELQQWDTRRSITFQPLFYQEANINEGRPFPIVHMINPAQVVALQYYNACLILIRQHRPLNHSLHGFELVKERRNAERDLITALGKIIGLAESNSWVENANFTAHHMLRNSGYHIIDLKQREHSISFLHRVQSVMGFKTESTVAMLRDQWQDLD